MPFNLIPKLPSASAPRRPLARANVDPSELDQLLPLSWRGIVVPVSSLRTSFTQDLAEHKYYGIDAAQVEATGRSSFAVEATIPFFNGVVPGKSETFSGTLYPEVYRQFLAACADGSSGALVHPGLGDINAKLQSYDERLDPSHRDGVEVTVRWVQSNDTLTAFEVPDSPEVVATIAATDLDASEDDIRDLAPEAPEFSETFESMMRKITAVPDQLSITANLAANKPAQVFSRISALEDSLVRAKSALTWPHVDNCERVKNALLDLHNSITKGTRTVLRYTTAGRASLSSLASTLSNSIDELIRLNPQLLSQPDVIENTVIRYYRK